FTPNTKMNHIFNFASAPGKTITQINAYLCTINTDITPYGTFYDTIPGTCRQNPPSPGACTMTASINSTTSISCFGGNNGSATVSATGGTTPLSYVWSNGQTSSTATGLAAGT